MVAQAGKIAATPAIAGGPSDLSGVMDHPYSILEADRAVGQLLDQVLTD